MGKVAPPEICRVDVVVSTNYALSDETNLWSISNQTAKSYTPAQPIPNWVPGNPLTFHPQNSPINSAKLEAVAFRRSVFPTTGGHYLGKT